MNNYTTNRYTEKKHIACESKKIESFVYGIQYITYIKCKKKIKILFSKNNTKLTYNNTKKGQIQKKKYL